jgi:hypothetical protein
MSVTGISSNGASNLASFQSGSSTRQQFEKGFQQLGKDLAAGNLSAAQAEFASLPKPGQGQTSTQPGVPIEQAFGALGGNLQSGDLAAAQQDFNKIQKYISNSVQQSNPHPETAKTASEGLSVNA